MALFGDAVKKASTNTVQLAGGFGEGVFDTGVSAIKGGAKPISDIIDSLKGVNITGGNALVNPNKTIKSSWGNLNKLLLAKIQPCDPRTGVILDGYIPVICPINEANMEASLNWQSPFESAGAESKAPALMALIQSGQTSIYLNALRGALGDIDNKFGTDLSNSSLGESAKKAEVKSDSLVGRTGITKLNSRQVFGGLPPLSITGNLHFRAIKDPIEEVLFPVMDLWRWALPQKLAADGTLKAIYDEVKGGGDYMKGLFPSQSPLTVAFTYAGETISPLVIETIQAPLDNPRDSYGNSIHKVLNITLSSLTSLDKNDVTEFFK